MMPRMTVQKIQSMVKPMGNDKVINKLLKSLCKHLALLCFIKNSFVGLLLVKAKFHGLLSNSFARIAFLI